MQDWHNPVLIRKHFDNESQAKEFKIKYGNKHYEIVSWKVALSMGLKDWFNKKPNHRHPITKLSKYNFPSTVKTQLQKQIFRHNSRKKLKKKKRVPMLNYKIIKEILDQKEMLFFVRLRKYSSYYKAYSEPVKGFNEFKKEYDYPYDIVNLSAIYLCLKKYYDLGVYDPALVSIYIYEIFKEKVIKWRYIADMSHKDEEEIKVEFLARGFIDKKDCDLDEDGAWVESIYIKPTLVYPETPWFHHVDHGVYDHSVFELQVLVGIQGYTRARQPC